MNFYLQDYGLPLEVSHIDQSKQALIDFRDCFLDKKPPISNITIGKNTVVAV